MDGVFYPCRTSTKSKFGRYIALLFYPSVAAILLIAALQLCVERIRDGSSDFVQIIVTLLTMSILFCLARFLLLLGHKSYLMEIRRISMDTDGFTVKGKREKRYLWSEIGGIGIIMYAASASRMVYETQICIFLSSISNSGLKRLRDSYIYGAFAQNQYVLLDADEMILNQLQNLYHLQIDDFRNQQLKL